MCGKYQQKEMPEVEVFYQGVCFIFTIPIEYNIEEQKSLLVLRLSIPYMHKHLKLTIDTKRKWTAYHRT